MAILLLKNSKTLDKRIFANCNELKKINIPSSIGEIKDEAFIFCNSMSEIEFESPGSLQTIGKSSFESTGIKQLHIKNLPLSSIEQRAFMNCEKLNEVLIVGVPLKKLGIFAFRCCSLLTKVSLPNSVESIGKGSFSDCINLVEVNLPSSLKKIDDYLFMKCKSLKKIEIPKNVASIGLCSFSDCSSLSDVIFQENCSLTKIGECAFNKCEALKEIKIPSSVTEIAPNAFKNNNTLPVKY